MNVPLNDLWIKSLLFDLNYKFIKIGASLLALAKSIYYICSKLVCAALFAQLIFLNRVSFSSGSLFKEVWRSTCVVPKIYTPLPKLPLSTLTTLPEHATHQRRV